MKKLLTLTVILAALFASACESFLNNDITIKNGCDFEIKVNIAKSNTVPASFINLAQGASYTFEDLESDDYFIHVSGGAGAAGTQLNYWYLEMNFYTDTTWQILWEDSLYVLK